MDDQWLVVASDDRDDMWARAEIQVLIIPAELAHHTRIDTVDIDRSSTWLDIELDATDRGAVGRSGCWTVHDVNEIPERKVIKRSSSEAERNEELPLIETSWLHELQTADEAHLSRL